jgi:hypothetical protein
MAEKPCNIAKAVGFISVDGVIVIFEGLFESVRPCLVKSAESLPYETVESGIGAFL